MLLDVRKPQNYLDVAVSLSKELAELANKRQPQAGISEYEIERMRASGLLALVIPKKYGGVGATWAEALKVVQEIAKGDGAIAQLYGNHLNLTALAHVSGTLEQKKHYYQQTAQNNWLWANAINTWDTGFKIIPEGENFRLNGIKKFDTVVAAADLRVFSAVDETVREPFFFIIPKEREGVIYNNHWNNFGQGQRDNIFFTFQNVLVKKNEILPSINSSDSPFCTFMGILAQLTKTYVYLGIANGALKAAQEYRKTQINSGRTSKEDSTTQDHYILGDYSDLWLELKTAIKFTDQVADIVQVAWERELTLTHEQRGEIAIAVFSAEAFVTRVGWQISDRIFELIKIPSHGIKYSVDRYWRDLHNLGGVSMPWKGAPQNWTITNVAIKEC